MFLSDADYFTRRALTQLDQAAAAADQGVARVHVRLSDLYLERARTIMGRELNGTMPGNTLEAERPAA